MALGLGVFFPLGGVRKILLPLIPHAVFQVLTSHGLENIGFSTKYLFCYSWKFDEVRGGGGLPALSLFWLLVLFVQCIH